MRITRLTATFGTLQSAELELHDGLNVLELPNEAGKSTWTAFLFAMLYGVDTAERAAKGVMPAKTKYLPWSGAPMSGRMELEWNGRSIVIERSSAGRVPMGAFRAYDAGTGAAVPGLTAQNCGDVLMGAEKGVCLRSAIIRQAGLSVSQDASLEKRLAALASSGEEQVSELDTGKRLQAARNRCRHNQTGRIPELQRTLDELDAAQRAIRAIHAENLQLSLRRDELEKTKAQLLAARQARQALEQQRLLSEKRAAGAALMEEKNHLSAARQRLSRLPEEAVLTQLGRDAERLQEALDSADAVTVPEPEPPECPEVFAGLSEQEILPKAHRDQQRVQTLRSRKKYPAVLGFVLALAFLLAGILMLTGAVPALPQPMVPALACGVLFLAALALGAAGVVANSRTFLARVTADEIVSAYGCADDAGILDAAQQWHDTLILYQQSCALAQRERSAAENRLRELEKIRQRLLGSVSMFAPEAGTLPQAREAIGRALALYDDARQRAASQQAAQARYDAVCTAIGEQTAPELPDGDWEHYDFERAEAQLLQTQDELSMVRTRLDMARGRAEAMGSGPALAAQAERVQQELQRQNEKYRALELAQQTLADSGEELRRRVSPQVCRRAGELFARFTGGRYDQVVLDRELNALAHPTGDDVSRTLAALSAGTADQLYLALRLALCELILDRQAPVILDDALVMFDDTRLKTALEVLLGVAEQRQILLFTCQSRENSALRALQNGPQTATI